MTIYANSTSPICIGRAGENLATEVIFDISNWVEEYGKGNVELVINQNTELYPQKVEFEDNLVKWTITNSNTFYVGFGKCELFYYAGEVLVKSAIYDFIVVNSLDYNEGAIPPEPYESWVEEVLKNASEIKEVVPKLEKAELSIAVAENAAKRAEESAKLALEAKEEAEEFAQTILNSAEDWVFILEDETAITKKIVTLDEE